ncbi:hypothetical protein EDB81DRAFT_670217 [Dactylonectria macrodidyma]|uniref:Glucose-methanol-choline oxidoreductase N-terminal domain-containing protein n=1 Tax=Dactylonectria macrodidyma TaxID=307937 RepID=A0A9P9D6B1_9HYPO|nr:hypothetical protein EDB81DRAFT_670217 [Dactylonectria macrodidyma]
MDYDFIVIGAGPAGCSVASALANCKSQPRVLLLEAGGPNSDVNMRIEGNKYIQFTKPGQSRSYESEPVAGLDNRRVALVEGTGLGGSTAINFAAWTPGPKDDMDSMARYTGDAAWNWEASRERLKKVELFANPRHGSSQYVKVSNENHGYHGLIRVGYPTVPEKCALDTMKKWSSHGIRVNRDACDGSHLGICIAPATTWNGTRGTAADLIDQRKENLCIVTDAQVFRVLFKEKVADAVELVDGRIFRASKEIVLSAGARGTPKMLLLSGIGPVDHLSEFGISIVYGNKNVGQNYRDHSHVCIKYVDDAGTSERVDFFNDPLRQQAALHEWQLFRTGEYCRIGSTLVLGFFKSPGVLESSEFQHLSDSEKLRLQANTIPSYEVALNTLPSELYDNPVAAVNIAPVHIFIHNSQSTGQVRLHSIDPFVSPSTSLKILEHPYDRRVAIEATREVMEIVKSTSPAANWIDCPASESEDDILDFWVRNGVSSWHATGTCRMGKDEKEDGACVDTCFRVFGVTGLRVADLSVMPISPSTHPQTTAYQIGMLAAEKIITQHDLNGISHIAS